MMRSMYSGVAGLKTHQTKMDVIGNNIANVNTVAYKSQSVTFSELMYQTTQAASGANAVTGTAGINARQIGLGVKTGAINTAITSQGASQTTNNPFDIRLTGDAFFIVSNGQDNFFTRDGSFYVDGLGNLAMTSNGYNVMGWQVDPDTMDIKQDTVSALRIMSAENLTYPPEATTKGRVTGIIDKYDTNITSSSGKVMNFMFYDKLGYPYTAKFNLKNTNVDGEYTLQLDSILDANNNPITTDLNLVTNTEPVERTNIVSLASGYGWEVDGTNQLLTNGVDSASHTLYVKKDGTTTDDKTDADIVTITIGDKNSIDADEYKQIATAYGFDSASEFASLGFKGTAQNGAVYAFTIADYLANTTQTGLKDENGGDVADTSALALLNRTDYTKSVEAQTIKLDGAVKLYYDTATGAFNGIGGKGAQFTSITLDLSSLPIVTDDGVNQFPDPDDPDERNRGIIIDFSATTMYNNSGTSTISASSGDANKLGTGRKLGNMTGVSIQDDGRIYASYDNGMSELLGQIAVAEFANASGLEKEGDNLYKSSQNSGEFDGIGIDVKSGGGYMTTGVLEMSNVDLSAEFTEMITTQRGFQANSRIITVSDTLLEELVNLKR